MRILTSLKQIRSINIILQALIFLIFSAAPVFSQGETKLEHARMTVIDSAATQEIGSRQIRGTPVTGPATIDKITLDPEASLKFIQRLHSSAGIWKKSGDPLREALGILIFHASRPEPDTIFRYLSGYDYESIRVPLDYYYKLDSVRIILPFLQSDTTATDSIVNVAGAGEMFIEAGNRLEKVKLTPDDRPVMKNDTLALNDSVYILVKEFVPAVLPQNTKDTIILVVTDTLPEPALNTVGFPFRYLKYPYMTDSLSVAVNSLLTYIVERDSTELRFIAETGRGADVWLNSRSDKLIRFWLPDGEGDSVTVWIGSPRRNTVTLKTEEGVLFKKQMWHDAYVDTRVNVTTVREEALRKMTLSKIKPNYWKYKGDISYLLSQGLVSNWAKGGENNISSVLDISGNLDYNNKESKVSSATWGRLALGLQTSGKNADIRKNLDIIEIYSKLNHNAFGKFNLSGTFQFKTQFLPGYNYPNDSVKVSKFFNPAILIFGYGLDYKPNKTISINFSPVSYKGTFVPDTAEINQTKYGVPADRKSKNEMGSYLTIISKNNLFDKVNMTNRVQLFSNFLNNPLNIDIDWEMIATMNLNWFTDLKINTHLIYDDDTVLPVFDEDGEPVLGPDGKQKKAPKLQFKEILGVSFVFRF
ncbi:MAG: DUF3078 domain-containing protein [Bacteroidales bacterium]|jgi:hypothetical protein|nr:DUF3078 domain-containing protein [Bacteroidales bacterium]